MPDTNKYMRTILIEMRADFAWRVAHAVSEEAAELLQELVDDVDSQLALLDNASKPSDE